MGKNLQRVQDMVDGTNTGKIGISLSSGIDSTLVLALLREEYPSSEIESISVKFSKSIDETNESKKISEKFDPDGKFIKKYSWIKLLFKWL